MEVTVYSMEKCSFCHKQRDFLKRLGIDFVEKDIQKSKKYQDELTELGGKGTPFTIIKENEDIVAIITGFNQMRLVEALRL